METKTYQFFISCVPGFEDILAYEIKHYLNDDSILLTKIKGGIEVTLPIEIGFALNQHIKSASRVLIRIEQFKCKDIPKLYQKVSKIPWAKWLLGANPNIKSESHQSRLFDDRKINQAVLDGIELFFNSNPRKKKYIELYEAHSPSPTIYVRFEADVCTISLDTTGELLHLRGGKELPGLAPIRENMAYALLAFLLSKTSGEKFRLIDPMCGSGTFLLEAVRFISPNDGREFSYQLTPLFLELKNKIEFKSEKAFNPFVEIIGCDINPEIVNVAKKNLEGQNIKINLQSVFENQPHPADNPTLVIVNPPYGKRVKSETDPINLNFFKNIISACYKNYQFKLMGIIIPSDYQFKSFDQFKIVDQLKFRNGGIPVVFYIVEVK